MHPCVSLDVPRMSLRYLEHAALDRPSSEADGEAADRSSPIPARALPAPEIQSTRSAKPGGGFRVGTGGRDHTRPAANLERLPRGGVSSNGNGVDVAEFAVAGCDNVVVPSSGRENLARAVAGGHATEDPVGGSWRGRGVTLRHIAERAGVHVSTVSRVLRREEPTKGWSRSERRVIAAASELGYRPNPLAASLRTRTTATIGVVMPRLVDSVVASIFQGIEGRATTLGYQVLISSPEDDLVAQRQSVELLLSRQVDGLLLSSVHNTTPFLESLAAVVPTLLVSRHDESTCPAVTGDDHLGGYLAARHLLELGHRRIGVVAGPSWASTGTDRLAGYQTALREAGIQPDPTLVRESSFDVRGGTEAGTCLLTLLNRPTAVFAVNDVAAIGVLGAARRLGMTVPADLSVVGYNDIDIVSELAVPLTTVRSPFRQMGEQAVEVLLEMIAGRPAVSHRLPVELVVRSSTAPLHVARQLPRRRLRAGSAPA